MMVSPLGHVPPDDVPFELKYSINMELYVKLLCSQSAFPFRLVIVPCFDFPIALSCVDLGNIFESVSFTFYCFINACVWEKEWDHSSLLLALGNRPLACVCARLTFLSFLSTLNSCGSEMCLRPSLFFSFSSINIDFVLQETSNQ